MTDPHQAAASPGTNPADVEHRAAIAEALGKEVWPADKEALVAKARESNASDRVLADLARLPAHGQFTNVQEVAEALGIRTESHRF